jgi:hypothetical protein
MVYRYFMSNNTPKPISSLTSAIVRKFAISLAIAILAISPLSLEVAG